MRPCISSWPPSSCSSPADSSRRRSKGKDRELEMSRKTLLLVLLILTLFPIGANTLYSDFYVDLATKMMIFGIALLGYDIIAGYTGLVSLGHAMFFGIGGYCA